MNKSAAKQYAPEKVNLAAIRKYLTKDLNHSDAHKYLGDHYTWPFVSGARYEQWQLDDGNVLYLIFANDKYELLINAVVKHNGIIIEEIIPHPLKNTLGFIQP